MSEIPDKQHKKQLPKWLEEYKWKPGESGNPNGRPPGKTLKEWAREFFVNLPDDEKLEFIKSLPGDIVWRMAEGNPQTDITSEGKQLPTPLLLNLDVPNNDSNKENSST